MKEAVSRAPRERGGDSLADRPVNRCVRLLGRFADVKMTLRREIEFKGHR